MVSVWAVEPSTVADITGFKNKGSVTVISEEEEEAGVVVKAEEEEEQGDGEQGGAV